MATKSKQIKQAVKERYGALARQQSEEKTAAPVNLLESQPAVGSSCCAPATTGSGCCSPAAESTGLADELYSQTDLSNLPDSVTDISLGCGNPTAISTLKPGETVLDLGSGGGIDCFIAAKAVGPSGHVIGVDMTDDMLALANKNKAKLGIENVDFRKGEIEDLPVESDTVDIIISNCVINLSPDKDAVFQEAFRVLKPGGRFAVSDIVTEGEIPEVLRENMAAWAECVTGAIDQNLYLDKLRQAGFVDVAITNIASYGIENLDALDEQTREILVEGVDILAIPKDARVYSANVVAYKPEFDN